MGRGWVDRVLDRGYVRNNVHSKKKISFNNLEYTVWIIIIYFVILFSFSFFFFLLHNLNSDIKECKSILRIRYKTNQFIEFYVETFIKLFRELYRFK